jgi:phage baseplate assembly protein W
MSYGLTLKLNESGDFIFDPNKNTLNLVSNVDNMIQTTEILLKTFKGERKTFPEFGIDIPQMLDKNISDDNIKHTIVDAVRRDPRVKSINKVTLTRAQRILNIYVELTTYDGAILDFRSSVSW